jgi:AAA15 family ATPase/GTPase
MDLKTILKDGVNKETNIYIKSLKLKDIERRSKTTTSIKKSEKSEKSEKLFIDYANEEIDNIFKKNWNKLDLGSKTNRMKLFINSKSLELKLNKNQKKQLEKLLIDNLRNSKLNKNSDIIYNLEECNIEEIKILSFNEETNMFEILKKDIKKKPSKSKSSIDKFF